MSVLACRWFVSRRGMRAGERATRRCGLGGRHATHRARTGAGLRDDTAESPAAGGGRVVTRGEAERANAGSGAKQVRRKRERPAAGRWRARRRKAPAAKLRKSCMQRAAPCSPSRMRLAASRQPVRRREAICSTPFLACRPEGLPRAATNHSHSSRAPHSCLAAASSGPTRSGSRAQTTRRKSR